MKLPFIKWFPNDWLAEPSVRSLSLSARGLWIDMLSLMHLSPRRGYLLAATGTPYSPEQLARLTGCSADEATRLLAELTTSGACSCTDDGTYYSRRMVREENKRDLCSLAGQKGGGNPNLKQKGEATFKGYPKGDGKGESKGGSKPLEARFQTPEDNSASQSSAGKPRPPSSESSPDPSPKKTRPPDTPHHRAISCFSVLWLSKYGMKYPFNAGKDGEHVRWMLAQVGGDDAALRPIFERYLADSDPFYAQSGHDLGTLRSKFTRWLTGGIPHGNGTARSAGGVGRLGRAEPPPGEYDAFRPGADGPAVGAA